MEGFAFQTEGPQFSGEGVRHPVTDTGSKSVMLTAERHDEITITSIEDAFRRDSPIPDTVTVQQRSNTYYGPKLQVVGDSGDVFLITAPGPDRYLYLWGENKNDRGERECWYRLAEIRASLSEDQGQYHLCHQCNEPLRTAEHERLAAIGQCPNV